MREALKALAGKRFQVFAIVKRFGKKKGFKGPDLDTVCFTDIRDKFGNLLTGHLWLTMHLQLQRLQLKEGDKVRFSARSMPYMKGYKGRRSDVDAPPPELDYCLKNASGFFKITGEPSPEVNEGLFSLLRVSLENQTRE